MCWMVAIPVAITAITAVASAIGNYQDAKAQNKSLEFNAQTADQNARAAFQDAAYAREQGERNAVLKRKETQQLIGAQRAKAGASGATVNTGSFRDVQLSTAEEGEKDAMAILQQADVDAWKYELQAGQYQRQSWSYRASKTNPNSVLIGGLLSAGAQTASSYFTFSQFGGGGSSLSSLKSDMAKKETLGSWAYSLDGLQVR